MENIVTILILVSMLLFAIDTFRCFSKVYQFDSENGYRDETICYIRSPHMSRTKRGQLIFTISKWTLKVIIIGFWASAIYVLVYKNMKFHGMLLVFVAYMLVVIWFEVYSIINGARILDSGIAYGLDKIKWERIEEFQFNNKNTKIMQKTYIKLKYQGRIIPKYIQITTENKDLVKRLFKEKCAA